jgi:hypothetical protein
MRRIGLFAVALAALSGCGLASFDIEVKTDGSGKVSFVSMEFDSTAATIPAGVQGVTKAEHFRVAASGDEMSFADVRKFKMGSLALKWTTRPGTPPTVLVTLDTHASALWFKRLGVTPERLLESRARAKRFYDAVLKDMGAAGMAGGDPDKVVEQLGSMINVGVKLEKAGKLKATLVKPAKLPAGWELSDTEPSKVTLAIPAEDLLKSKVPSITFSVGPKEAAKKQ